MRMSIFTEAQIIGMIKEQEASVPTFELCLKHGFRPATFSKLEVQCGGIGVSSTKRLLASWKTCC